MQIGEITPVGKELEHLALDLDQVDLAQIYLYNGDELVDVCEIDSSINQAELDIVGGYTIEQQQQEKTVATYLYTMQKNTNMVVMKITPKETENIAYYRLTDTEGNAVFGDDMIAIEDEFTYLSLLVGDLADLKVVFYDTAGQELYQGIFVTGSSSISVIN